MRVGIIGARKVRQGTGPYVARAFAAADAELVAVLGSSAASAASAAAELEPALGVELRPHACLQDFIAENLDVIAICSPVRAHEKALEAAAAAELHVLCEKPLIWRDEDSADPVGAGQRAGTLAARFAAAGRLLGINAQWPFTLESFEALHPGVRAQPLESFQMRLSPIGCGPIMMVDAAPHLLSLLRAIAGPGRIERIKLQIEREDLSHLDLHFDYQHETGSARVQFELVRCLEQPRPAWYEINGHRAERKVELPSYRMSFIDGARRVPVADPLYKCINQFCESVRVGAQTDVEAIAADQEALARLIQATEAACSVESPVREGNP